jgi:hypothetical protein
MLEVGSYLFRMLKTTIRYTHQPQAHQDAPLPEARPQALQAPQEYPLVYVEDACKPRRSWGKACVLARAGLGGCNEGVFSILLVSLFLIVPRESSIDKIGRSRHIIRVGGGQERCDTGHVIGPAEAAERNLSEQRR